MATLNNNLPARIYTKEYIKMLSTVFNTERAFLYAYQDVQMLDGVNFNATAFTVKTNATPVVIGTYNTGAAVAFGAGTGGTTRFGNRTEIIYTDTDVPYDYLLTIHEGLDTATANIDIEAGIADRLLLQSQAQTKYMNTRNGLFLSTNAGNTQTVLNTLTDAAIKGLFDALDAYYTNKEVIVPVRAYLAPDLYNAVVDHPLVTRDKASSVQIDDNGLLKFKNFTLVETPAQYFASGDSGYFCPDDVCVPFVGVNITRAIESEDFAGIALQSLAKGGSFILDDNKVAVTKVKQVAP